MTKRAPEPAASQPDTSEAAGQAISPAADPLTLTLDIGGTGLKAGVLDPQGAMVGERHRVKTPHPSGPAAVMPALLGLAGQVGSYDRVSVGFPGVVRGGVVRTAPNLGTPAWAGFDLGAALQHALGKPVRMLNDARVQGLGVITGRGLECVITLGTGFGFALYEDGRLAPHLEMGQHPAHNSKTYDEYLGVEALHKVGRKRWRRRVERAMEQLRTLINFDTLYVGGGDAQVIDFELPSDVRVVSNDAGILGGVKLWDPRLDDVFEEASVPA